MRDNHPVSKLRPFDMVELRVECGRWSPGTIGTVLEISAAEALVEVAGERGNTLDLLTLPVSVLMVSPPPGDADAQPIRRRR